MIFPVAPNMRSSIPKTDFDFKKTSLIPTKNPMAYCLDADKNKLRNMNGIPV